jgi:hypothetical protein
MKHFKLKQGCFMFYIRITVFTLSFICFNLAPCAMADSDLPTKTISPSQTPTGLKEPRGVIIMGIQANGMFGFTEKFIALYDDGAYTNDLTTAFDQGVAHSKQKNPKSWGSWRIHNEKLELKKDRDESFEKTRGDWIARAATKARMLSGCYGRLTTNNGADYTSGTTVGVARTWCFWPDGGFTNSSTAFGNTKTAGGIHMKSTSPKTRGRYFLNGYTAHFIYGDGHEIQAAFCFANEKKSHIVLNGKRFMGHSLSRVVA